MVEKIEHNGVQTAIIIRNDFECPGISFVTPDEYSQQMAYMQHPAGHIIEPHFHNEIHRIVQYTQEVLVIKSGRLEVNFYDEECREYDQRILYAGDIILLCAGGHGFKVLEDIKMVEIKQGPYAGENDKTRFQPVKQ